MAFVNGIVYRRIAPGQTLTIFGGFFDVSCSVLFNDMEASVVDYDDEKIEVVVPIEKGEYTIFVVDGDGKKTDAGKVSIVELTETPNRGFPKEYKKEDFVNYIMSLMPRGNAFSTWNGSNFRKVIDSIALAFLYVWGIIREMVKSTDPTHTDNIDDWENELNLPVLGIYPDSVEGRRSEIYRVECTEGGCSKSYYKKILSLMGIEADVYEYTAEPEQFSSIEFGEDDPNFYARIVFHMKSDDFSLFRAGESYAGDYLLDFNKYAEEEVFENIKQSHIKIVYGYDDGIREGCIIDESDNVLSVSDGGELFGLDYYEDLYNEPQPIVEKTKIIATSDRKILETSDGLVLEV